MRECRVGCAGWSIPRAWAERFPGAGSHLERYARMLPAVEINSSFYRHHARTTYERWAASVPRDFRFAVKLPREITHIGRLRHPRVPLQEFLQSVRGLGRKLGVVVVQLPPTLRFDSSVAERFLVELRAHYRGAVALEARHPSWFAEPADRLLGRHRVARVAADPPPAPEALLPGGWRRLVYYRLHGSPRLYWSPYSTPFVRQLAIDLKKLPATTRTWVVFNNTAAGAAVGNALELLRWVKTGRARR